MKKIITLLLLLSSLCFSREFKYYHYITFEKCIKKLNELNKNYNILSYQIVPAERGGSRGWIDYFNIIIEVEPKTIKEEMEWTKYF